MVERKRFSQVCLGLGLCGVVEVDEGRFTEGKRHEDRVVTPRGGGKSGSGSEKTEPGGTESKLDCCWEAITLKWDRRGIGGKRFVTTSTREPEAFEHACGKMLLGELEGEIKEPSDTRAGAGCGCGSVGRLKEAA